MAAAASPPASGETVKVAPFSTRMVLRVVMVIVIVVLALWLIYQLRQPLTWIFIAGFLAIALSGPVDWLHRRIGRRKLSIAIVYIALILVPVILAALLVPPVVEQLNNLINNLPVYVSDLQDLVEKNDQLRSLEQDYNITAELQKQASTLPGKVGDAAGILSDIGLGLVNSIFAGITILVLSLFMMSSGRGWLDWLADRQGEDRSEWLKRLYDRIGRAVGNYVAGALGQALIAGVLAYIVLLILGVPYAGSLAVVIFLLDLVPLVGATLGAVLVGIITLFNDFPTVTIIWVDLVDRLPAGREQHHPAPDPGPRGPGAPVRRARLGAVRLDALRRARRAARDPDRRRDRDLDRRVQPAAARGEHRRRARADDPPREAGARRPELLAVLREAAAARPQQRGAVEDQPDGGEQQHPREDRAGPGRGDEAQRGGDERQPDAHARAHG